MRTLTFSPKQLEFIRNATHRWNFKVGATQCGKTYIDTAYVIPARMKERRGLAGLNMILGVSKLTIERNVLTPMRDFWGDRLVGRINSENIAIIFGERVYCLGAEKVSQVAKLRGAKIKYAYLDEAVEFNKEVFELLKSRLSLPYSICDGTGNPASPTHWLKEFLDSSADVYCQCWTIFDNPFLTPSYVDDLCKEYEGTVYYDRYILGRWKLAEGVIYNKFANNPEEFLLDFEELPRLINIEVGVDFGGNKSAHAFVATGFTFGYSDIILLEHQRIEEAVDGNELNKRFIDFVNMVYNKYGRSFVTNCDNAEPVLIRTLRAGCSSAGARTIVEGAMKMEVNQRIRLEITLMGAGRFWILRHNKGLIKAFSEAVWKKDAPDTRLDDGTSDIDSLDATEYSFEKHFNELIRIATSQVKKERKLCLIINQ